MENIKIGENEIPISEIKKALGESYSIVDAKAIQEQMDKVKAEAMQIQQQVSSEKAAAFRAKQEEREAFYKEHGYEKKQGENAASLSQRAFLDLKSKLVDKKEPKENKGEENITDYEKKVIEAENKAKETALQLEALQEKFSKREAEIQAEKEKFKSIEHNSIFEEHWNNIKVNEAFKGGALSKMVKEDARAKFVSEFDSVTTMTFDGVEKRVFLKDGNQNLNFNPTTYLSTLKSVEEITKSSKPNKGIPNPIIDPSTIGKEGSMIHKMLPAPTSQNQVIDFAVSLGLTIGSEEFSKYIAKYPNFDKLKQV